MPEEAKLRFYNIDECGYYDRETEERSFGTLTQMLANLRTWYSQDNRPVRLTRTFGAVEDSDIMPVYCVGIRRRGTDVLLATWNETPATDGATASIRGDDLATEPTVDMTRFRQGNIPGYATYFWFIEDRSLMATIRFQHTYNGHQGMKHYLKSFLQKFSPHAVASSVPPTDDHTDFRIGGYRATAHVPPSREVSPRFKTSLVRKPGPIESIRANRTRILRIIQRDSISPGEPGERNFMNSVLRRIGVQDAPASNAPVRYEFMIEHTPSEAQLNEIINAWTQNEGSQWDDVGFILKGDPNPLWLSHAFVKPSLPLAVTRDNAELVNLNSLLDQLVAHREEFLADFTAAEA